ncbi:MAG TPA: DUF3362 domain-containing protein, partial [Pirellulales bacterium]|jgi:hypothetical protein|nr:DUF3362 domain-containing protein [Pirellulales bacterium]
VARNLGDRKLQRALLQFFKPENYFEVRKALEQAGRQDLIGSGCDCLIADKPPKEALDRRRKQANVVAGDRRKAATADDSPSLGYRPGRKTAKRRKRDAK